MSEPQGGATVATGHEGDLVDPSEDVAILEDPTAGYEEKVTAAERLGRSGGEGKVVDALIGALYSSSAPVRGAAAFALGRLGDLHAVGPLMPLLQDPSDDVRCRAAVALGLIGSLSVLRSTTDSPQDAAVRWSAIQALGNLGAAAVDCLAKALEHGPRPERAKVVIALGETRDVSAVGPLTRALDDEDETVVSRAREALEKIRETRVF